MGYLRACCAVVFPLCLVGCGSLSPLDPPKGFTLVEIPSVDDVKVHAYYRAPMGENRPVVISLHGADGVNLGRNLGSKAFPAFIGWDWGLVVVDSFRPRGVARLTGPKKNLLPETRRQDVLAVIRWLRTRPEVDAKRIALYGISHGARTALSTIDEQWKNHPDVACAVAVNPGCEAYLGIPNSFNETTYKDYKASAPLLVITGGKDTYTPAEYCARLCDGLKTKGARVEYAEFPEAGHSSMQTPPRYGALVSPYDGQPVLLGSDRSVVTRIQLKMFDFLHRQFKD